MGRPPSLRSYSQTTVPVGRSKENIEDLLLHVGATGFRWLSQLKDQRDVLDAAIEWNGRTVAFRLTISYEDDRERKQRLRALYWYLKTKVEAVQFGLVDLEQEFLPYLLTDNDQTIYERLGVSKLPLLEAPKGSRE